MSNIRHPAIPNPSMSDAALLQAVQNIRISLEILNGHSKSENKRYAAITWDDLVSLGLITESDVPK